MPYVVSNDTAQWLDGVKSRGDLTSRQRRGWILPDGGGGTENVRVCLITGGDALTGYTARAYASMVELRRDTEGTGGEVVTIFPCEIGLNSYLPEGTIVLCHSTMCRVTGGTENTEAEEEEEEQQGD